MNPSPPAGPLDHYRRRFADVLQGLEHPPLGAVAALAEECGEVAKLLLDHHAYGKPLVKEKLGGELADVLVCLCEMATLHGVDLDHAIQEKLADLSRRAPAWRTELGSALATARNNPPTMGSSGTPTP